MKKLLVVLVVGLFCVNLFAQKDYVPTQEELLRFKKTKTLVVLEDNALSDFNITAQEIMPQEWKVTPFGFISWKEFEQKRQDPTLSFILIDQVKFELDKANAKYNFLSLVLGGTSPSLSNMADLCSVPLSYTGVDEDHYSYKLALFLRFMQNHIELLIKNPDLLTKNIFKHYNDSMAVLHGKTIYFVPDELSKDVNTLTKIKKIYPDNVKLVNRDQVREAIDNREPNVVILHKVGPEGTRKNSRCYKILIGIDDARFYYFDYHTVGDDLNDADAFLASDMKKIAKK
jgi:hypothetical protein